MKMNKNIMIAALVALSSLISAQGALADDLNPESALTQELAKVSLQCAHQPYSLSPTGRKILGQIRSHCDTLVISQDRAEFNFRGLIYTMLVKNSESTDHGDLNDLYLQFDSREDQEITLQKGLLAFGDPILALLFVAGESPDQLPQILN